MRIVNLLIAALCALGSVAARPVPVDTARLVPSPASTQRIERTGLRPRPAKRPDYREVSPEVERPAKKKSKATSAGSASDGKSREKLGVCGIPFKTGSYATECRGHVDYKYQDPSPNNVNGALTKVDEWLGNGEAPISFECDHLIEAQWLAARIEETLAGRSDATLCDAMKHDEGAKLTSVMNGATNMWGVPRGVNQLKKYVTKKPDWTSWDKTVISTYNFNKARGGLVQYMSEHEADAQKVASNLYTALHSYDSSLFPDGGETAWKISLAKDYKLTKTTLSNTAFVTLLEGHCKKMHAAPQVTSTEAQADASKNEARGLFRYHWARAMRWTRALISPSKASAKATTHNDSADQCGGGQSTATSLTRTSSSLAAGTSIITLSSTLSSTQSMSNKAATRSSSSTLPSAAQRTGATNIEPASLSPATAISTSRPTDSGKVASYGSDGTVPASQSNNPMLRQSVASSLPTRQASSSDQGQPLAQAPPRIPLALLSSVAYRATTVHYSAPTQAAVPAARPQSGAGLPLPVNARPRPAVVKPAAARPNLASPAKGKSAKGIF